MISLYLFKTILLYLTLASPTFSHVIACRTIPYHTIPYPYHTIPYRAVCCIVPYYIPYNITNPTISHIILYYTIPYHTIPCRTISHTIPWPVLFKSMWITFDTFIKRFSSPWNRILHDVYSFCYSISRGKPQEKCPLCQASYFPENKGRLCSVCKVSEKSLCRVTMMKLWPAWRHNRVYVAWCKQRNWPITAYVRLIF